MYFFLTIYLEIVINLLISRLKKHIKSRLKWEKEASTEKPRQQQQLWKLVYFVPLYKQIRVERGSFFQTQANTTLLSTNDPELQCVCPGFGEYLPCPAALLQVSHRANEWPFYSSGGVPWPPETENLRQGKPNVPCWQFSLFPTGENNKDNMVHLVAPKQ